MLDIAEQIKSGRLVAPGSREPLELHIENCTLVARDTRQPFRLLNGRVPVLLRDESWAEAYVAEASQMLTEYEDANITDIAPSRRKKKSVSIYAKRANRAELAVLDAIPDGALCLSVGGGPGRAHPSLCNVNIGPFPNVDVVGDAHELPYADNSVDAIYCSAVIEHLHTPEQAVKEMFRVMKSGGRLFASTPFVFVYHGYPHHYQNYTLTGHQHLFERCGFRVAESGVSTGPAHAVTLIVDQFIRNHTRGISRWAFKRLWRMAVPMIRRVDDRDEPDSNAHLLAANTYVVAEKP
jgi:SAM-dependent methyltransferase